MFQIDFRTVYVPKSWEKAHEHFNSEQRQRKAYWQENERPLRDARSHHLRIVRRSDESYDLMLYSHTMIRYFKPESYSRVVDVFMPWGGISNWNYIWQAGFGWGSKLRALRRKDPVWLHPYPSSEPESRSAHLVFKRKTLRDEDLLDTTQSWQLQAYRYKYIDPTRNERLAFMRDRMQSLVILLGIAQNSYQPEYDRDYARLFMRRNEDLTPRHQLASGYNERRAVLSTLRRYASGKTEELTPEAAEGLTKWFERSLDARCSKGTDTPMTDQQIEASIMRLLLSDTNEGQFQRVKVPVQMWRSGGNRPSRTRSFQTRAEAEKAREELKLLKQAVDEAE